MGYLYLAPLLLQIGDLNGYRNCRAQILREFGNTTDPRIAERMVISTLIIPAEADQMPTIEKMAAVAISATPNKDNWGFNLFAKGLTEYRLGHFAEAASLMQQVLPMDAGSYCRAKANLVLAMAQFQLNQAEKSRESFADALKVESKFPQAGHLDDEWNGWISFRVLKREAVALNPGFQTLSETKAN
jgi:tetratricopeptide (TPR) repeat protein